MNETPILKTHCFPALLRSSAGSWLVIAMMVLLGNGCHSKTERKAEAIIQDRQEVAEAKEEGKAPGTVQKKEAALDNARAEYEKAWNAERIKLRQEVQEKIKATEAQIARMEADQQKSGQSKAQKQLNELRQKRNQLGQLLEELNNPTEATWDKLRADLRRIS